MLTSFKEVSYMASYFKIGVNNSISKSLSFDDFAKIVSELGLIHALSNFEIIAEYPALNRLFNFE